jgi:hypothetical protein
MTDIIIINPSEFIERRSNIDIESSIYIKYEELYKKYSCFSNTQVILPRTDYAFKGNNRYNNKKGHFNDERSNYMEKRPPKELNKIILGILNVLSNDNYDKMFKKIKIIKSESNIGKILLEILDKCSVQVFYLNIYMRLIEDLLDVCNEIEKKTAIEIIDNFVNNYIDNSEWLNEYINDAKDDDYNSFCNSQKLKSLLIAKNMMVNRLMMMFKLEKTVDDYVQIIINDLKKTLDEKNENVCIIIIQMMIYMIKTLKALIKRLFDIDQKYIYTRITGSKTKFIIDEFLPLLV